MSVLVLIVHFILYIYNWEKKIQPATLCKQYIFFRNDFYYIPHFKRIKKLIEQIST